MCDMIFGSVQRQRHLRGTDPDAMEAAVYANSVITVREMCRLFNSNYMTIHREMRRPVKVYNLKSVFHMTGQQRISNRDFLMHH